MSATCEKEENFTTRETLLAFYLVYAIFALGLISASYVAIVLNHKAILGIPYPIAILLIAVVALAPVFIMRYILTREESSVIEIPPDEWIPLVLGENSVVEDDW